MLAIIGILFLAVIAVILAVVAYSSNNRKRAAQNQHSSVVSESPKQGRAISGL